jgi:hypothetical protein
MRQKMIREASTKKKKKEIRRKLDKKIKKQKSDELR